MVTLAAAPREKFRVAPRFSNHFEINQPQSRLDFVDVLLDTDVTLYIDPFALSVEDDDWSRECNDLVVGFFQELVDALRSKRVDRAREILNNLHEPNETRLGQSSGKPRGRGVGPKQSSGLYAAFADSKAVETGILADLSDCELFIDGIGHDKISDITTNIIRRKLIEFTKEQCHKWGVPMQFKPTGPWWDPGRKDWRSGYDTLPVYLGEPLILVPKRSVRYSMAIDDKVFYDLRVLDFIREEFNRAECLKPGSSLFKLLKLGKRVTKKDVAEAFPKSKDFLREVSERFPDVLQKYKQNAKWQAKSGKGKPSDFDIYEIEKKTAHKQGFILVEETHLHFNNVGGDNFGSVGQGNRVVIKDVTVYKHDVDAAQTIGLGTKDLLKQAIDAIDVAPVGDDDKDDAKENLQKLTDELAGDKNPGRISRFIARMGQVVPAAASILKGGEEIVNLVSQIPNPFGV